MVLAVVGQLRSSALLVVKHQLLPVGDGQVFGGHFHLGCVALPRLGVGGRRRGIASGALGGIASLRRRLCIRNDRRRSPVQGRGRPVRAGRVKGLGKLGLVLLLGSGILLVGLVLVQRSEPLEALGVRVGSLVHTLAVARGHCPRPGRTDAEKRHREGTRDDGATHVASQRAAVARAQ